MAEEQEHKKKSINEEKATSASYVIDFYNNVINLTTQYANYMNILSYLKNKYGDVEVLKIEDNDKAQLIQCIQLIKIYAVNAYVRVVTIYKKVNKTEIDAELEKLQIEIETGFIYDSVMLRKYVLKLNSILAEEIMTNLLSSSNKIVQELFG